MIDPIDEERRGFIAKATGEFAGEAILFEEGVDLLEGVVLGGVAEGPFELVFHTCFSVDAAGAGAAAGARLLVEIAFRGEGLHLVSKFDALGQR